MPSFYISQWGFCLPRRVNLFKTENNNHVIWPCKNCFLKKFFAFVGSFFVALVFVLKVVNFYSTFKS